ncbi:NADP-dependent oxidoreductase [Metabacillus iocasae]|uniref:NADPH-dependent curcumin reductase CurA n=1 Tax=Priestia iocasae TaxID=2291674 RepID=A0ABS2R1D8_9BACI|nr:NADP-dependent oxidoreductase [Metabacillus iocasae]MBM7705067.1 NADPH-dependent curcumin reductase CurA [Metabacillus iocasae]
MNEQILLAERPKGMPTEQTFTFEKVDMPSINEGEVLVKTLYLSVDPYMRGRMNDTKSYVPPFQLNEVISGGIVGKVVESKADSFQEGEIVTGYLEWKRYSKASAKHLQKVDPNLAPISTALGVLGMPGLTAYFGLLDIGQPKEGETVVVSGAAGAVGTIVGQIAKIKGARVVGIAGSQEKIDYLKNELGFDAVINYKEDDVKQAVKDACPNGVDVYFDNVGGEISDAVTSQLNKFARIPLCGQIALYNLEKADIGPRVQRQLLINSALMKGFIVGDYAEQFPEGIKQLGEWVQQGRIKYSENIVEGFENVPSAFLGLFKGENLGKQLVKVADQ